MPYTIEYMPCEQGNPGIPVFVTQNNLLVISVI